MNNDLKYWAFISYSHTDETWAKWLHKRLETFPVPRTLVGRPTDRGDTVPRRIAPVFRDRDELPGASRLENNIRDALAGSRYLIVICSPRSAVSRWVNEEVIAFKTLGRADRILCLIIDGEPNATDKPDCGLLECFPPAIRHVVHPDGSLAPEREEPIAADARMGKDGKADALLKLVAGVLGVGFDDLKRREERRRRQQRLIYGALMAGLCAVFAWGLAVVVKEQKRANEETEVAKAVLKFLLEDLLEQSGSSAQADAKFEPNPNLTVREALDRASARIGDRFTERPAIEEVIRLTVGRAFTELGSYDQAVGQLERVLASRRARLGPEHRDTIISMGILAVAYRERGDLGQAMSLSEEALKLFKAKLGPEHPDTIDSMINVAVGYMSDGKPDRAVPLLEGALKLTKARLGPEHRSTFHILDDLAIAYATADGTVERALPLFEEALKLRKAKLGPEHPDTLVAMVNLAITYRDENKSDQAVPMFEEALKLHKAKLGPEHPDTLHVMGQLAAAYHLLDGKLDRALPLYQETLKLMKVKLGPEHPETLKEMVALALAYSEEKKFDQAVPLLAEALKLRKTTLGPEHRDTITSMSLLAIAYDDIGKLDQALPLHEETLKLRRATLGPEHPDTLRSTSILGDAYESRGKLDQARPLLEEAFKLRKTKLGPEHPDTLNSLNQLAGLLNATKRLSEAVTLLRGHAATSAACLAGVRYKLASYECLSGNLAEAKRLIAEEIAVYPKNKKQALQDSDLEAIREFIRSL